MSTETVQTFCFVIEGNQEDPKGNPIPKIKKTFRQRWSPEAQRYKEWKRYVVNVFGSIADALFESDKELDGSFAAKMAKDGKGTVQVKILLWIT